MSYDAMCDLSAHAQVVFDPSWNPAHDLQAQDRAYRLGQTRDVAVYRLVGTGMSFDCVGGDGGGQWFAASRLLHDSTGVVQFLILCVLLLAPISNARKAVAEAHV